jgi:hypothetical protein
VEELESTSTRLRETEHTLNCTKTVLQRAATEREEQRHLVEKHVETELKLAQQAKKLLATRLVTICNRRDFLQTILELHAIKYRYSSTEIAT